VVKSVDDVSNALLKRGKPRSSSAAAQLVTYDRRIGVPLVLSALLPLVIVPQQGHPVSVVVGIVSWLVFVLDFVVHERLLGSYLRTHLGQFDLAVVILTAPWFLLPGAQAGAFIVVLRLARLVRLVIASHGARVLVARLGKVVLVALSVTILGAATAYYAEHPTNPEFANYGDSLWWAFVTLTTVGYGDIVPTTPTGRYAAVVIMIAGVSVLGVLAGTLASFFHLESTAPTAKAASAADTSTNFDLPSRADAAEAPGMGQVLDELSHLSEQLAAVQRVQTQVAQRIADLAPEPVRGDDE
jgi:voltage-gated potassium channel